VVVLSRSAANVPSTVDSAAASTAPVAAAPAENR